MNLIGLIIAMYLNQGVKQMCMKTRRYKNGITLALILLETDQESLAVPYYCLLTHMNLWLHMDKLLQPCKVVAI